MASLPERRGHPDYDGHRLICDGITMTAHDASARRVLPLKLLHLVAPRLQMTQEANADYQQQHGSGSQASVPHAHSPTLPTVGGESLLHLGTGHFEGRLLAVCHLLAYLLFPLFVHRDVSFALLYSFTMAASMFFALHN